MGKIIGYYCPYCGKEYSTFYEKTICIDCLSALFVRYDYFPCRKIKSKIRSNNLQNDFFEGIMPDTGKTGEKFLKNTSLIPVPAENDDKADIFIKNEAELTSGCIAERGLNYIFPDIKKDKIVGGLFYDETIYSAIFLKKQYKIDFKLLIPEFIGENNINKLFKLSDNVDVVEGKDVYLNLFNYEGKSFFHSLNNFKYIEGLKRVFFEIVEKFSIDDKIHFIISGIDVEMVLAWGKTFIELKLLSIIKPSNFVLHCFFKKKYYESSAGKDDDSI